MLGSSSRSRAEPVANYFSTRLAGRKRLANKTPHSRSVTDFAWNARLPQSTIFSEQARRIFPCDPLLAAFHKRCSCVTRGMRTLL